MKRIATLLGAFLLVLCFGASQAVASDGGGAAQTAGQSAESGQTAGGASGAYQAGPSNSASSIRVLSPGNGGAVSQSNSTTAGALAANGNSTSQNTAQSQLGGGFGSDQTQIAGQSAKNTQDADAAATAVQIAPSNDAQSIRVLSPGNDGNLDQSNSATAGAAALNGNETDQSTDQSQAGGGYGSDQTQVAGQAASNDQSADADAAAFQVKPSNSASSIRVLSPGDDGDVSQENAATAIGIAANGNSTEQSTDQAQAGGGYGSKQQQVAGQEASNTQDADAKAAAAQIAPSNTASSIRVLSPGNGGNVSQSNSTTAVAAGLNGNKTEQSVGQSQTGGAAAPVIRECGGCEKPRTGSDATQIAGQKATNNQSADAQAAAVQVKPSNSASSIRVLSPGNDGDVTQSNSATAVGLAANLNLTGQAIDQEQAGSGPGAGQTQVAGQESSNAQSAKSGALAVQLWPSNTNRSIRVLSPGDDGDVSQSNSTTALAAALNLNATSQSIDQSQAGGGHGGSALQVAGQGAWSRQGAAAGAAAFQLGASNDNDPVRVGSPGGSGSVEQSNDVTALAVALNLAETCQTLTQKQAGQGSGQLQVAGQGSWGDQRGDVWSRAMQGRMLNKKNR